MSTLQPATKVEAEALPSKTRHYEPSPTSHAVLEVRAPVDDEDRSETEDLVAEQSLPESCRRCPLLSAGCRRRCE